MVAQYSDDDCLVLGGAEFTKFQCLSLVDHRANLHCHVKNTVPRQALFDYG